MAGWERPWHRRKRDSDLAYARLVEVSGEIATIRITIGSALSDFGPKDTGDEIRSRVSDVMEELTSEFSQAVTRRLGEEFMISSFSIQRRSVDLLTAISTPVGTLIAYGALRQAIDYLVGDFRWIVIQRVGPGLHMDTAGQVVVGPGLLQAEVDALRSGPGAGGDLLVRYLVVTNTLLLSIVGTALLALVINEL